MADPITARLQALRATLQLCRPRTLAELRKRTDEQRRELAALADTVTRLQQELATVTRRERQLRAIASADAAQEARLARLDRILQDAPIAAHVRRAIASATVHDDPFPYAVVDDLLPEPLYDALIEGLPPAELFADRAANKQQLTVPFELAPAYSRRVWGYMANVLAPDMIAPAIVDRFRPQATAWLRQNFPAIGDDPLDRIAMTCSDGRIMLRRPGYYIPPHRDPKWGFLTCLIYLARPGDSERWGTDLLRVREDEEAPGVQPHWIDERKCEPVEHVAFRRNRALIFLNSTGAHSARIPADAQPAELQRYAYQFRVGAASGAIRTLVEALPADRRAFWAGKASSTY